MATLEDSMLLIRSINERNSGLDSQIKYFLNLNPEKEFGIVVKYTDHYPGDGYS